MAFIPRIYVGSDRIENGRAYIDGSDANHVLRVLRKSEGDRITVCDMHANTYSAVIGEITEGGFYAVLGEAQKSDVEMPFSVTLYQCMPKGDKPDTIVQKAVELGVTEIVFVDSERCVAKPDSKAFEKKLVRYQRISESAAAQCGRSIIPRVRGLISFDEAVSEAEKSDLKLLCYEGEGTLPINKLLENQPESIAFIIGPEGGISEREVTLCREKKISLAGLGKRILRTETASGYVLSAISVMLEL